MFGKEKRDSDFFQKEKGKDHSFEEKTKHQIDMTLKIPITISGHFVNFGWLVKFITPGYT